MAKREELEEKLAQVRENLNKYREYCMEERRLVEQICELDRQDLQAEHANLEGKCYRCVNDSYKGIQGFKILRGLSVPNENYALCLCVTKCDTLDAFADYAEGLRKMVVPVWGPVVPRLMLVKDEKAVIDLYEEITDDDFSDMICDTMRHLSANS